MSKAKQFISENFDPDTFSDYVTAHGYGEPTKKGYDVGRELFQEDPDYATVAFEVVFRGLTKETDR